VSISVFPNPASEWLNINCGIPVNQLSVSDLSGRNVLQTRPGGDAMQVDISGLAPGMYFLQLVTSRGMAVRKFMVARD